MYCIVKWFGYMKGTNMAHQQMYPWCIFIFYTNVERLKSHTLFRRQMNRSGPSYSAWWVSIASLNLLQSKVGMLQFRNHCFVTHINVHDPFLSLQSNEQNKSEVNGANTGPLWACYSVIIVNVGSLPVFLFQYNVVCTLTTQRSLALCKSALFVYFNCSL